MPYSYRTKFVLTSTGMKKRIVRKKSKKISIPTPAGRVPCPYCRGSGQDPSDTQRPCPDCGGAGSLPASLGNEELDTDQNVKMDEIE